MSETVPGNVRLSRHVADLDDDGHEDILSSVTTNTDTAMYLSPDGTGGVAFGNLPSPLPFLSEDIPKVEASTGAAGGGNLASKSDHVHPAYNPTARGEILISDTPSTPLVFADMLQDDAQADFMYADP